MSMAKHGYLELIIGPMFSGKTTQLLDLHKQYKLSNMRTCVINYSEDTRYHSTMLSTHDKSMIECESALSLTQFLKDSVVNSYDVFLINEGQFFDDIYESVHELVDVHKKIVHVAGLDGDFKRNPFGKFMKLIPLCDKITKKTAICSECANGTKALFSHRLTNEQGVKVIGSSNYAPLCRQCYNLNTQKVAKHNTNLVFEADM